MALAKVRHFAFVETAISKIEEGTDKLILVGVCDAKANPATSSD